MSLRKRIQELATEQDVAEVENISEETLVEEVEETAEAEVEAVEANNDLNNEVAIADEADDIAENIEEVQGGIQEAIEAPEEPTNDEVVAAETHLQHFALRAGFINSLATESITYFKDKVENTIALESMSYASASNRDKLKEIDMALEGIGQSIKDAGKYVWDKIVKVFQSIANFFRSILSSSYRDYKWLSANKGKAVQALLSLHDKSLKGENVEGIDKVLKSLGKVFVSGYKLLLASTGKNNPSEFIDKICKNPKLMTAMLSDLNKLSSAFAKALNNLEANVKKDIEEFKKQGEEIAEGKHDRVINEFLKAMEQFNPDFAKELKPLLTNKEGIKKVVETISSASQEGAPILQAWWDNMKKMSTDTYKTFADHMVDSLLNSYNALPTKAMLVYLETSVKVSTGVASALTAVSFKSSEFHETMKNTRDILKVVSASLNLTRQVSGALAATMSILRKEAMKLGDAPKTEENKSEEAKAE